MESKTEEIDRSLLKHQSCYLGIEKKDYPKWIGWKIIKQYKEVGVKARDITDARLDYCVKNFYVMQKIVDMK